jgi:DNA replication protein DnaC
VTCTLCDGSGFLIDEATNTARDCECRPRRIAIRKAQRLEARLPKRYLGVGFDREPIASMPDLVVRPVKRFVRELDRMLDQGRGLYFAGPVGTGKTTLAMLVSGTAIRADRSVAIYSTPRLLNVIRDTIGNDGSTQELLDRLATVDLLHLDDVGAESTSDWVLEQLYSIVNARYEDERSTMITTNLMPDDLAEQIGARTVSRLVETCELVPVDGHDRRMEYRPS